MIKQFAGQTTHVPRNEKEAGTHPDRMIKRPRGRPRSAHNAEADATIGRTVWQLVRWGYRLRRQVLPAVAAGGRIVLQRTDSNGLALSSQRIEQIYESWAATTMSGWVGVPFAQLRSPSSYSTEWRVQCRPHGKRFNELVLDLLQNKGKSTIRPPGRVGDPVFTRDAHEEIERTRPRGVHEAGSSKRGN
ncbi:MAG: hypothetical protein KIT63_23775 [Rhodoferax sp.]|nr:hypothetical protein [Rhodoferax sp.]